MRNIYWFADVTIKSSLGYSDYKVTELKILRGMRKTKQQNKSLGLQISTVRRGSTSDSFWEVKGVQECWRTAFSKHRSGPHLPAEKPADITTKQPG